jgi:hypothetical protein
MSITNLENTLGVGDTAHGHQELVPGRKSLSTVDVVIPCYNYG